MPGTLSIVVCLGLCLLWPSGLCFAGAVTAPVAGDGINDSKLESSTARTTPGRVQFLAPKHDWTASNSTGDLPFRATDSGDHTKQLVRGPLRRSRRKVISKGGHYLVRSKMSGKTWMNPSGSAHSGAYDNSKDAGAYSGGRNSRGRLSRMSSGGGGGRKSTRYAYSRRGNRRNHNSRKKISQTLKMEIGQYALQKGASEAADQYAGRVGRRLKDRIVEKFARRFRLKQERRLERNKEGKTRFL